MSHETAELLARLTETCERAFPLRIAVLFGSRATGRSRPGSDFDVGIVPVDPEMSLRDELALSSSLSAVTGAEVELVRLDRVDPLVGREVARDGVCLFEQAPGTFAAYRADAMSTWIDFEETIAPHRAHLLRRLGGDRHVTNVALVGRKLGLLLEHLRRLRERRPAQLPALRDDLLLQDAMAMGVLVVTQESMDIALHIAADEGWELASTYRDSFMVLARHGVIEGELATALASAAQLRNRIAHGYASLDVERLWSELPSGVTAFESYAGAIAAFLRKTAANPS